jgi:2-polyprenyl-6-methoxyphenol hydroxylase-like FAD-dependent oxidoreductase
MGLTVDIVEQSPALAAVGAGITIQANATAIFNALGIELRADDIGPIGYFEMLNASGQCLMSGDPEDADPDHPSVKIHRADLQRGLLDALQRLGGTLELGRKVVSLEEDQQAGEVKVGFEDGAHGRWDLVIGVDGLYSNVRRALLGHPASKPRYAGQTCWRFAIEAADLVPEITVERWSMRRRIGLVPLSRGRIYVYLVESAPEGTPGLESSSIGALTNKFLGIDDRLDLILSRLAELDASGHAVPVHHGDLCELSLISYGRGRVVLLGDAAHAMTPNMGQGAGTAIEDAAALSLLLPKYAGDLAALPEALQASRHDRVRQVQKMSWRFGAMAHIEGRVFCWLRDFFLRLVPKSMSRRQMSALWQPGIELGRQLSLISENGPGMSGSKAPLKKQM